MSSKDSSDSFDALFADALKAVEKNKKPPKPTSDSSLDIELDVDIDFDVEEESDSDSNSSSDVASEAYDALLEEKAHLDVQYDQLQQQFQQLQSESTRLQQRLASAHTHMQSMMEQRNKFRDQNKTTQQSLEDNHQRIRMLEAKLERQNQQLEKNGAMRRKERQEVKKYGATTTLKQLLPALDSLDLAVKNENADPESLRNGLRLLQAQFIDALNEAGVQRVSANPGDKFNPAHHEAVMRIPSEDIPTNHIVEAFCGAYTLHERLLRAAMVSVAAPKK